ncbi:RNA dependent RNA polymerase [Plasmopara viticola lesion associated botybirna 2]|uniref:RNA-directed RNA polymerase n=1 Tax=Plasmopara viticola lesion associated botybirna 2 TaxID=2689574 RepID=A0A6B9KAN0_9VIRU|nr:RNA dependent RNA polymerase [Plasmopara viticola lesion associated botybirna 2]
MRYTAPQMRGQHRARDVKRVDRKEDRTEDEYMAAAIALNVEERARILRDFPKTNSEARAVDTLFPRGKDGQLKRAIYTLGHLLMRIEQVPEVSPERIDDVREFVANAVGGKNAWATGVVMFIMLNTLTEPCYLHLKGYGLLTTPYSQWYSRWSNINDVIRNQMDKETWVFTDDDFAQCLYIGGLVGRPHREVDWDAEKIKRTQKAIPLKKHIPGKGFVDMDEADEKDMILAMLRKEAKFKIKKPQSLEEVYKKRMAWMKPGSLSGEKTVLDTAPEVKAALSELGVKVTRNTTKLSVAETAGYDMVENLLDMEPIHLAKMHTKGQENGKIRSIQASVYSHYVLGSYWSMYLETTLQLRGSTMNKPNSQLLAEKEDRRQASADPRLVKVCADYPDFGATHSGRQQRLVLECILQVAIEQGFQPDEEFMRVHNWYSRSFENQYLMRPDDKTWFKSDVGMFSGVVQTTLFNTVLNRSLEYHYLRTLQSMGSPVAMLKSYGLGDDSWGCFATREEASSFLAVIPLCGKDLNPLKQLVSSRASEYLREWYMGGKVTGCATRALAMLVSGNVESNIPSAGVVRIRELYETFCTLAIRLFNRPLCQWFFEDLATYEARRGAIGRRSVLAYMYGAQRDGGLALYPIYQMPGKEQMRTRGEEGDSAGQEAEDIEAARLLVLHNIQNRFRGSRDQTQEMEKQYHLTWKHNGQKRATARLAAQHIVDRNKNTSLLHDELEANIRASRYTEDVWLGQENVLQRAQKVRLSPREVDKQYNKVVHEDQILLSELGQFAKVVPFVTEESLATAAASIGEKYSISQAHVLRVMRSLSVLKGSTLEYVPRPYLSAEMMGLYTNWQVVNKLGSSSILPEWLPELAKCYRT